MASIFGLCAGSPCMAAVRASVPRAAAVIRLYPSHSTVAVPKFYRFQSTAAARAEPVDKAELPLRGEPDHSFTSLKGQISYDTLKAITVKPFKMTTMTPVQAAILPLLPALAEPYDPTPPEPGSPPPPPRDLLVKAKTGTGKTLAFLVPAIEARLKSIVAAGKQAVKDAGLVSDKALEGRMKRVFARTEVGTLILSPTRELATQIANEALRLAHHHDDLEVRLFTGGMSKRIQMRDWMKGRRDIVVATPGRLIDVLKSEPEVSKGLSKTRIFVLDEADTLLDQGFRDDIEMIKEYLPPNPERQNFLFSATVTPRVQQIARTTLDKNHMFINTVSDHDTPVHANIPQFHTVLPSADEQIPHVVRLIAHDQLTNPAKSKIILFLPTTKMTQLFSTILRELSTTCIPSLRNSRVYEIHSKRTQEARTRTSDAFRHDKTGASILVTSDVSARGVDYPGVTRVIQVGIPAGTEQYIHRIGRTGRAGTSGRGDLVLLPWEVGFITWQLDEMPLKPLTSNELKSQVSALAKQYDADPAAVFKGARAIPVDARATRMDYGKPRMFASPILPATDGIAEAVGSLLPSLDEEAVKETFASLLGYYLAKSPELRVQKGVIVQGCKDWTTGACGLPVPPYVSDAFLQKMGFADGRTKRFGRAYPQERSRRAGNMPSWGGRGRQSLKGRHRDAPEWARFPSTLDPDDPIGDPAEYRGQRYDSRVRGLPPRPRPTRGANEDEDGFGVEPRRRSGNYGSDESYGGRDGGYRARSGSYGSERGNSEGRRFGPRDSGGGFGLKQ